MTHDRPTDHPDAELPLRAPAYRPDPQRPRDVAWELTDGFMTLLAILAIGAGIGQLLAPTVQQILHHATP